MKEPSTARCMLGNSGKLTKLLEGGQGTFDLIPERSAVAAVLDEIQAKNPITHDSL